MLKLALRPSRTLAFALTVAHGAAAVTLVSLDLLTGMKAVLLAAIAASLACALRRYVFLRSRASVVSLELLEDDRAIIQAPDGSRHAARILGTTYVSPLLTAVNLRVTGRAFARHALIVPDNSDAEAFRRARVWLRWAYRKSA